MVLLFIRLIFILSAMALFLLGLRQGGPFAFTNPEHQDMHILLAGFGCLAVLLVGLAVDLIGSKKSAIALSGIFFGLIVGLLIGRVLNLVVEFIYETYDITESSHHDLYIAQRGIFGLINIFCSYLAITFILQTKDDFRFIIPYVEFSKQTKGTAPLLLDTSVIIDGRIADIATTKIINTAIIIPRFILNELQVIADSADRLRRNRGRRGLDILNKMQSNKDIDVRIEDIGLSVQEKIEPVDHQLVSAAKKLSGKIITNDYNLNKVCSLRGVDVININDLAQALKPVVLPGEMLLVKITKTGDQPGQGVGYLDDGTMVVVDQGRDKIGNDVDVIVTSVLQTSAGRMIFGKL